MVARNAVFTEAGASTRWCPFARVGHAADPQWPSYNRIEDDTPGTVADSARCVASECMAWRWFSTHIKDPNNPNETILDGQTYGYCGLAGSARTD